MSALSRFRRNLHHRFPTDLDRHNSGPDCSTRINFTRPSPCKCVRQFILGRTDGLSTTFIDAELSKQRQLFSIPKRYTRLCIADSKIRLVVFFKASHRGSIRVSLQSRMICQNSDTSHCGKKAGVNKHVFCICHQNARSQSKNTLRLPQTKLPPQPDVRNINQPQNSCLSGRTVRDSGPPGRSAGSAAPCARSRLSRFPTARTRVPISPSSIHLQVSRVSHVGK